MSGNRDQTSQGNESQDEKSASGISTARTLNQLIIEQLIISVDGGFIKLLEVYERPLRIYTRRLASGSKYPGDADDIYQEAMYDVYQGLKGHEGDVQWYRDLALQNWLYTVTHHAFLQYIRKGSPELVYLSDAEDDFTEELKDDKPSPELIQEHHEFQHEVSMGIEQLGENQCKVLQLHCFDHLTDAEIATKLGMPINTVRSHLLRGRKLLHKYLEGRGQL